jgi:methylenetetrahydrofolate reductase (NADPH)
MSDIAALVAAADIEVIPLRGAEQQLAVVPAGTAITITCSPKLGLRRTLDHAELAVRAGHRVVPHVAARQVTGVQELRGIVERLDSLGVKGLYVVGGDAATPAGDFASAAELIEALDDIDHGLERIGIACYPEGHPKIADDELLEALRRKQSRVHYMVSQLCFDAAALVAWIGRTRAAGIRLPLHLGLAAPMNMAKLVELSIRIGVGSSVRYLAKQRGLATNLIRAYRPEELLHRLGPLDELGIERLHLCSFNQIPATLDWQRRLGGDPSARTA